MRLLQLVAVPEHQLTVDTSRSEAVDAVRSAVHDVHVCDAVLKRAKNNRVLLKSTTKTNFFFSFLFFSFFSLSFFKTNQQANAYLVLGDLGGARALVLADVDLVGKDLKGVDLAGGRGGGGALWLVVELLHHRPGAVLLHLEEERGVLVARHDNAVLGDPEQRLERQAGVLDLERHVLGVRNVADRKSSVVANKRNLQK